MRPNVTKFVAMESLTLIDPDWSGKGAKICMFYRY